MKIPEMVKNDTCKGKGLALGWDPPHRKLNPSV